MASARIMSLVLLVTLCAAVEDRARVADALTTMMGHTRRETGKLVTYLRLVGVAPPEIKFRTSRSWR